jgi:hypothetical protein
MGLGNRPMPHLRLSNAAGKSGLRSFGTPVGIEVPSRSRAFLADDVSLDDYLMLGSTYETDPTKLDRLAFRVVDFRKIPSLDATDFERTAYL